MIQLSKTLKVFASSLVLAAAIGVSAPAFAQENYPPNIGPDGQPSPTTPLGGNGADVYGDQDPGLPPPPLPKGWKGEPAGAKPGESAPAQQANGGASGATAKAPPLPPGAPHRPMLERTAMVGLPAFFCSEREKSDWLLNVFYPAASRATKNNIKAHNHLVQIRQLRDASTGEASEAYQAELDAWDPIWRQGDALATAFVRLVEAARAIPVIDCNNIAAIPGGQGNMVAVLGAAIEAKPAVQVGIGSYADLGQRQTRPFDGSEAERALRERLSGLRHEHGVHTSHSDPVQQPPPHQLAAVTPPAPPVEDDGVTGLVNGPSVFDHDDQPPSDEPAAPGHTFVDPPVTETATEPNYPLCPTDGMPATPEHILEFHS